jgi:hypothetical protein
MGVKERGEMIIETKLLWLLLQNSWREPPKKKPETKGPYR